MLFPLRQFRGNSASRLMYTSLLLVLICLSPASHGETKTHTIAVLYPDVSEGYAQFFSSIIEGVKSNTNQRIESLKINRNTTRGSLISWAVHHSIEGFITLGQQAYDLATESRHGVPVVAGGLVASPNGITGISIAADPEQFFRVLKELAPDIKRVHIIYSEKSSGWLVKQALDSTGKYDIGLITYPAKGLQSATRFYKQVLENARPVEDAIWIPLDNVAPITTLLPEILQKAWSRKLVVFSNNLQHTRRGTLFSLYADTEKLGQRLMDLVLKRIESGMKTPQLVSTQDLKLAVNIRTANHLGIEIDTKNNSEFDLIFPTYK